METPDLLNETDHSGESDFSDRYLSITRLMDLTLSFDKVYTPLLCFFGTLGNCLSIIVFYTKYHRTRTSLCSSLYLSVLALSDTGFLLSVFIIWLQNIGIDVLNNNFSCTTVMYLGQVTGFLSVWFIVSFTVERFFAVCYPLSPATRFTLSRTKKIVIGLTVFSLVVFSYVFLIARILPVSNSAIAPDVGDSYETSSELDIKEILPNASLSDLPTSNRNCGTDESPSTQEEFYPHLCDSEGNSELDSTDNFQDSENSTTHTHSVFRCSVPSEYFNVMQVLTYIDTLVTFLIPFFIIAILNLRIMFCVKRFKKSRETMLPVFNSKVDLNTTSGNSVSSQQRPRLKDYLGPKLQTQRRRDRSLMCRKNQFGSMHEKECSTVSVSNVKRCCRCNDKERSSSSSGSETVSNSRGKKRHSSISTGRQSRCSPESDEGSPVGQSTVDSVTVLCTGNSTGTQTYRRSVILSNSSTEIRVTKTLLLVSSVFLVLNFPSHSIRIATFIHVQFSGSQETLDTLFVAQHWANFLFNANFAVNFLLYCYSGKTFRLALKNLLHSKPNTPNHTCRTATTSATTQIALNTIDIGSRRSESSLRSGRRLSSFQRFAEDHV